MRTRERAERGLAGVVVPVVFLLVVVALIAGLVGGGVLQGQAVRLGPEASTATVSTLLIEE